MRKALNRCSSTLGSVEVLGTAPGIRQVTDATYIPVREPACWGLYADGVSADPHNPAHPDAARLRDALSRGYPWAADHAYVYAGHVIDHYGHFMTDTLSRLWCLLDGA